MKVKFHIATISLFWPAPCFAHGGIGSLAGLALLFYLAVAIIPIPFLFAALLLRKKREPTNWLMLLLMAPILFIGLFFLLYVAAAIYQGIDFYNLTFGLIGAIYLVATVYLYLSCKQFHEHKT